MRVATIDIGTNTVLLLVAERDGTGSLRPVSEHATITRLGQGVDETRTLAPEAIARTHACLASYATIVRESGATRVAVVGTSAMRDAGGGDVVRAYVKQCFGVEARTISGDEEARLTFKGALSGLSVPPGSETVFDIGGGSTEVVVGQSGRDELSFAQSFDVGSVRLTERLIRHDPPAPEERDAVLRAARSTFQAIPSSATNAMPVGIAGTMTTLAAVSLRMASYDATKVHGLVMTIEDLRRVVDELAAVPQAVRATMPGLEPKRADVIVAGGTIALALLEHLGAQHVRISDRGVRWGLAEELSA